MTPTERLSSIYKASDCCDVADCDNALESLKNFARLFVDNQYSPAMIKRLTSLSKKRDQLLKSGKN